MQNNRRIKIWKCCLHFPWHEVEVTSADIEGRIFLPFVDDDPKTAEITSKIKDPKFGADTLKRIM